jgi:hypothetical protein
MVEEGGEAGWEFGGHVRGGDVERRERRGSDGCLFIDHA